MRTLRLATHLTHLLPSLVALLVADCKSPPPVPSSSPAPVVEPRVTPPISPPTVPTFERGITPRQAPPLPDIPLVEGPLVLETAYPTPNQAIAVRDSNFIFGSTGNGHATLSINGASVPVAPNGTFMAYLPVPPDTAPRYDLVARTATDSASLVVPVRVPPARPDLPLDGRLVIDTTSATPRGTTNLWLRDNELVRVAIRAPANASVSVTAAGHTTPLVQTSNNNFATDIPFSDLKAGGAIVVSRGRDEIRVPLAKVTPPPTLASPLVMLGDSAAQRDTDATVIGRDIPAGTYKWMLVPGTVVQQTGRSGDFARVRLDSQLEMWVDAPDVHPLPAGYPVPRRNVAPISLVPAIDWVDVVIPVSSVPPYLIEQYQHSIVLTLYGTNATPETIKFLQNDSLVRYVNWVPDATDRLRLVLELTDQPYGYLVLYESGRFTLRLRRKPHINLARPLEGLTIVVDPGHPPGGAIGPTKFTEAEGVLGVANKLRDMLQERGANVLMTRTDMQAVDLHLRSVIARRANAHAFVSVHENAFGDGTNPFPNVGTSTLFFHPQSEPLARLAQAGMMRELGLRDLGIHYQNIAIGRTMWMPSIITEGLFLMVPEQEYAAKQASVQERYARGVADGLEAYFRTLARPSTP